MEDNDNKIKEGMAEVCDGLAEYCEKDHPEFGKEFKARAKTFRALKETEEPKMNDKKKEDKIVSKIIKKIVGFEKEYDQVLVERACVKYKQANVDKRNAEKRIKELELELTNAKARLK